MLIYINKDIFEAFDRGEINILCHQVNCEGLSYFAGIAKIIHRKYPELTKKHIDFCNQSYMKDVFGQILVHRISTNKSIVNLYAQIMRGKPKKFPLVAKLEKNPNYNGNLTDKYFIEKFYEDSLSHRMKALENCLKQIHSKYVDEDVVIGMPLIASGLASDKNLKGDMTDLKYFKEYVAPIVEKELKDLKVLVFYL